MTGMKRIEILRPWAIFVWLFVWQAGVLVLDQQILLVSPVRVLLRLVELAVELDFWKAVAFSTLRITAGFLLGTMAGTMLAGVSARQRILEELLAPFMLAVKSIPVASFIILALILFSSRNLSVLISFLMVLPVLYSGILGGLRAMDKQMLEMVQLFRIPTFRRIRYVYLPQILPYFRLPVPLLSDCAGNRELPLRSLVCPLARLASSFNWLRFIWIRRICLHGRW